MGEPTVRTERIVKVFGHLHAVNGVDLVIEAGEIYGLVGPSGAGKTTLIRMICGLSKPTEGAAFLLGHLMPDGLRRVAAKMAYMPQERAVYRDLTVEENLAFFGEIYGLGRRRLREEVDRLLSLMEMTAFRRRRAERLSGGERQRLSLACALLHDPEVLLLDEPTIGLDPALRNQFWTYFRMLSRGGKTILLTTHYMAEAERCDRVGMLKQGKLIAEGEPEVLKEKATKAEGEGVASMEEVFLFYAGEPGTGT